MGTIFTYSLAVSLIAILLFPVLHQTVHRNTCFRFNRIVLLGGILLSLALPATFTALRPISFATAISTEITPVTNTKEKSAVTPAKPADNSDWKSIAVIIYLSGIAILLGRELLSYYRLFRLISKSEKTVYDKYTLCIPETDNIPPFSWRHYLILPQTHTLTAKESILIHEQAHIFHHHWLDTLFADLYCTLLWYNPAAWLTKHLIKLNHEFEADYAVINSGTDTLFYQRLLVTEAINRRNLPYVDSFIGKKYNFRKRILVMSQQRSPVKYMWIAAFTIPAALSAGPIIANPVYTGFLSSISDVRLLPSVDLSLSLPVTKNVIQTEESSIIENEEPAIKEFPFPFNDPTALNRFITIALTDLNNESDINVNLQITIDKDGRIKDIATSGTDNPTIKILIQKAANSILFEKTFVDGIPIEMHYSIPLRIMTAS